MVSRANVQSDRKGEVVRMTGHKQGASIQRGDSRIHFRGSLVGRQNPVSRGMLLGFAQCLLLILSLVLAGPSAMAQATTGISGVVQDASGAVVPNASVVATDTDTNFTAKAVSGPDGGFVLTSLPVGPYSLAVTATGFKPYTQTGIILSIAQVFNVQVKLEVGSVAQQVTVEADLATVQVSEPTVQTVVPEVIVQDLPLNGRQVGNLLYDTVPGVADSTINQNLSVSTTIGQGEFIGPLGTEISPATHGVTTGSTYYSLDGANNIDTYAMVGGPFPNPDATQEFNVATSAYSARYPSAPGGAVNIVTKSGTNSIHGSAFEYLRNGFFNANEWNALAPDGLKQHQFGGSVGAPIIKNRWFIFGSVQDTRQSDAASSSRQVATAAERAGNFAGTYFPCGNNSCPVATTVTSAQLGFVGNVITDHPDIPISGMSPVTTSLMTQYEPLPNAPGGAPFYIANVPTKSNNYEYDIKSDYDLGDHRIFGRFFRQHNLADLHSLTSVGMDSAIGGKLNGFTESGGGFSFWDAAALGDTWTKGQWVVDTRVSFTKGDFSNLLDPNLAGVTLSSLGAQNFTPGIQGGTGLIINAGVGLVNQLNALPRETADVSEDVSVIKGKHEFSFGGYYRRMHYAEVNYAGQSGVSIFIGLTSSILTGIEGAISGRPGLVLSDPLNADFILGSPGIFIQHDGFFVGAGQNTVGFYAEDKYRLTPRLTLTGGVRYDPYLPIETFRNQMTCWVPGEQSKIYVNSPTGLVFPGDPGCSTGGTSDKLLNLQPRVGFAWDPFGKAKTSIRGGYGLYSAQQQLQMMLGMSNPPWIRNFMLGVQPFMDLDNIWDSAGLPAASPFAGGFQGPTFNPTTNVPFPTSPFAAGAIAHNYRPPIVNQWTLSVQQAIGTHDTVQLAYVGTESIHVGISYDENAPALQTPGGTLSDQARRPDQAFNAIDQVQSNATSSYNGLEASLTHQMRWGLYLNSDFTWSKCIDDVSDPASTGGASNYLTPTGANRRGLCDFDQNFAWRSVANWNLPSLSKSNLFVREALGNWTASTVWTIQATPPFSIADGNDESGTDSSLDLTDRVPGVPVWIPNTGIGPSKMLNINAFTNNAVGTFGNSGRNAYRGPSAKNIDLALMKKWPIKEQFNISFRAEAFNLFNHPNFGPGNDNFNIPVTFGTYTTASNQSRVMQFALRLQF
jgi:Carboxypeptidase regulatory-like domain